jgi:hypothetical protein
MPGIIQPLNKDLLAKKRGLWLLLAWGAVQAGLLFVYGIRTELEPAKYIEQAGYLLETGSVSSPNFWLYSVQIFLFALAIKFNTGFVPIYLIQVLLNGLATWYFYRFAKNNFSSRTGFFIALIFILTLPIQLFNCVLQTESIFFSISIIYSCYLFQLKKLDLRAGLTLSALLILLLFTRPTGLLFVPGSLFFVFFRFFRTVPLPVKVLVAAGAVVCFFIFLDRALGSGGELNFILPFQTETIICGVPGLQDHADIKISSNPNSIEGLFYYVTHNPGQFLRLAVVKTRSFFLLTRPYYSLMHNALLLVLILPFYILSIISLRWWWQHQKGIMSFCLLFIIGTWASVILSCDDWHNRFFLTILPYIYILSLPAIERLQIKFLERAGRKKPV